MIVIDRFMEILFCRYLSSCLNSNNNLVPFFVASQVAVQWKNDEWNAKVAAMLIEKLQKIVPILEEQQEERTAFAAISLEALVRMCDFEPLLIDAVLEMSLSLLDAMYSARMPVFTAARREVNTFTAARTEVNTFTAGRTAVNTASTPRDLIGWSEAAICHTTRRLQKYRTKEYLSETAVSFLKACMGRAEYRDVCRKALDALCWEREDEQRNKMIEYTLL